MNVPYNKEALELFNQANQVAVNSSLAVIEQQVAFMRENAGRNLTRALSAQQLRSVEDLVNFQKSAGETEMAELKKAGEGFYKVADDAGKEFITVAKKAREIAENGFIEATEKVASTLPNGKSVMFSDMARDSLKTATNLFQDSFDAAVSLARAGADSVRENQEAVSAQIIPATAKRGKSRK